MRGVKESVVEEDKGQWRRATRATATHYLVCRVKRNGKRVALGIHGLVNALKIASREQGFALIPLRRD